MRQITDGCASPAARAGTSAGLMGSQVVFGFKSASHECCDCPLCLSHRLSLTFVHRYDYQHPPTHLPTHTNTMAALENAALDGTLFSNRSISPSRHSVDSRDEEDSEDDLSRPSSPLAAAPPASSHPYASSPSPRRKGPKTGPKGVIADQRSAKAHAAAQSRAELQSTRARQEKGAITASTVHDEDVLRSKMAETRITDQEKREEDDLEAKWRAQRMATLQAGRGGLREIGAATFLSTVERKGWALVLIYEPVSCVCGRVCWDIRCNGNRCTGVLLLVVVVVPSQTAKGCRDPSSNYTLCYGG